nr:transporter substrate-binding domain-containing protein [uncultured Desulfobacter sp.]
MKRYSIFSLIFICLIWSTMVYAEPTIYAIEIPGLHEKSLGGEYDKIIDKVLLKPGLATLKILPPAKVIDIFSKCDNCCFSPANLNKEFYDFGDDVVKTKPMNIAKIYIFTAKGKETFNDLSQLKDKKVGARFGMPYGKTFDASGLNVEYAKTIELNIKKLDKGRLDAFIAYVPDAYDAFKNLNVEPYPHDVDNPIAVHEDCLVCRGVSAEMIETFNNGL